MKLVLQREYLFWPLFLTPQCFRVYEISQFFQFLGFSQKQITREIQNQNMVPNLINLQ